ncbi:MAG TPA: thiamine pyrophosphate-binding protein [Chloroflexota bacterium]
MTVLTGSQAIVQALRNEGVDAVFGIPGYHNLALWNALADHPEIRAISVRHEQGAGYMAIGYARVTGRFGVLLATTGPGALNSATPLGEAYGDSVPVLSVMSEIESCWIGKYKGAYHESKDQLGVFERLSGWAVRAVDVADIPRLIREGVRVMSTQRPRPAVVEVPSDLLTAEAEVAFPAPETFARPSPDPRLLRRAAEMLARATAPIIWAGGGVVSAEAWTELVALAELLQAPVLTTTQSRGAIPEDHPLCLGNIAFHHVTQEYLKRCDLTLAVGTRFGQGTTVNWTVQPPQPLVHVDIDGLTIGRSYPTALGIVGDAKAALAGLLAELDGIPRRPDRGGEVAAVKAEIERRLQEKAPLAMQVMRALREALAPDAIVACDPTIVCYWGRHHFPVYRPRTFLYPMGYGTLGYAYPVGLGAKVAAPERQVVALHGDGGFLFTAQEMATAAQYGIAVPVVVFNDNAYGVIRDGMVGRFGRHYGAELRNPDFVKMAEAFGLDATRVPVEALARTLEEALQSKRPTLVEVPLSMKRQFAV